jgi:serine/threonine protein kinase
MRIIAVHELENWLNNGQVLEQDGRGPKVVKLDNGLFLKVFYTRRNLLRARLFPLAKRFARNAERLRELGIAAPEIVDTFWLKKNRGLSACLYRPITGITLEALFTQQPDQFIYKLPEVAKFIKRLHQNGIYFRSLHLGNIILMPGEEFGLIDILDLRIKPAPLSHRLSRRNFAHLDSYLKRKKINNFPIKELFVAYQKL